MVRKSGNWFAFVAAALCLFGATGRSRAAIRLYDKFDNAANWALHSGAAVTGGQLHLTIPANTVTQCYADTISAYPLTGSRQSIQVVSHSGVGGKSVFFYDAFTPATGSSLEMKIDDTPGGSNIVCGYYVNGVYHFVGSTSYVPTADLYFAFRESQGTLSYEVSADAVTWTAVAGLTNPFGSTPLNMTFHMEDKVYATGISTSTGTVLDNFNYQAGGGHNSLDDDPLGNWQLYTEPAGHRISVQAPAYVSDPTIPSGDGNLFNFQINSSDPYTNAYYFQYLPQVVNTYFVYTCSWKYFAPSGPVAQAYEFPFSKYQGGTRLEAAMQYLPNSDGAGFRWRVWGGSNDGSWRDKRVNGQLYGFVQNLASNAWHTFMLYGTLQNNQITYTTFVSDGVTFPINESHPGTTDSNNLNTLVVAYQIDNNATGNKQNVYLGDWNFSWPERQLP